MTERPNVILILTDDQGYGDLSCTGNPVLKTPHLDQLYDQSVRLTDYHVDAMCSPTRAALMTGRYAARTGVWSTLRGRYIMRRDEITIADVFADSGYRTGIFGKWHLGDNYPYRPFDRGFRESLSFGGGVVGEIPDYWDNDNFTATYLRNGAPEQHSCYCTDVWFNEAMQFMGADRGNPFFCYISTNAPHGPFNVHEKYSAPYLKQGIPKQRARFYGMIANIDKNIGRLRQWLADNNLAENTILIFMGDNGTAMGTGITADGFPTDGFNAGMRGKKTWVYDGGHRNACFIHWPTGKLTGGRDIDHIAAHIDILPTLIDLCELTPPDVKFDGISLTPLLNNSSNNWPARTLFVHQQQIDHPKKYKDFAAMTDRWRLVHTGVWREPQHELFDHTRDPEQRRDIAEHHPDIVQNLREAYETWWTDISQKFGEYSEIAIGSNRENPTTLTAHSWHGKEGIYNQWHVRQKERDNGFWAIDIEQDGEYEFELRRWPVEADTPICAALPGRTGVPYVDDLLPGEALAIKTAKLQVGDIVQQKAVSEEDKCIAFQLSLKAGSTRVQTWFDDGIDAPPGAYYVYVKRISPA